MTASKWTEADRLRAAEMLRSGMTGGQMAPRFGLSRPALIGRVHRDKMLAEIGFAHEPGGGNRLKGSSPRVARAPAIPKPVKPKLVIQHFECRSVPMLELRRGECRWPVNDAAIGEKHLFCGLRATNGAYCQAHHGMSVGVGTRSERDAIRYRRAA